MTSQNIFLDKIEKFGLQSSFKNSCCSGQQWFGEGVKHKVQSPIDSDFLGEVLLLNDEATYKKVIRQARKSFNTWRHIPAPKRGDLIRQMGNAFREHKEDLATVLTLEMGKPYQESLGEIQEVIDICDFATGLSRQLYGFTMHSERPSHRMYDQYHPLGVTAIISAFNFPIAVWAWNAMLATVCGNTVVWKPSEKTPFCAILSHKIVEGVLKSNGIEEGVFNLILGDYSIGEKLSTDTEIPLVSATGSTSMGKKVAEKVSQRLGKSLLELGGNNALIVSQHANKDLALLATLFGAVGTSGQRCTSTRRVIIHESIYTEFKEKLLSAYQGLRVGNPLDESNHLGPLIDAQAVDAYLHTVADIKTQGGKILYGGSKITSDGGFYVHPTVAEVDHSENVVQRETFAPIAYLVKYSGDIENAIRIQNDVKQGLSSAIFTENMREAEIFLSSVGSDCGIANVNIGTSGAEIGGAFGGEKETGGGRESGSDSWKAYMRRQTNTINYSKDLPLAQGIKFDV